MEGLGGGISNPNNPSMRMQCSLRVLYHIFVELIGIVLVTIFFRLVERMNQHFPFFKSVQFDLIP